MSPLSLSQIKSKALVGVFLAAAPFHGAAAQSADAPNPVSGDGNKAEVAPDESKRGLSDEPVQFLSDIMPARPKTGNAAVDNMTVQQAIQNTADQDFFYDAIKQGLKAGRLIELRETDREDKLLPVATEQYSRLKEEIQKKNPLKKIHILVDLQDNDGLSKMNLVITPRGAPNGGDNYLIISEGAHKWTPEYVEAEKTLDVKQLNNNTAFARLLLSKDSHASSNAAEYALPTEQILKITREVTDNILGKDYPTPDFYVNLSDKDDKNALPDMSIYRTTDNKPVIIANTSALNWLKDKDAESVFIGHEEVHWLKGHISTENIARLHNLPYEQRQQEVRAQETLSDETSVDKLAGTNKVVRQKLVDAAVTSFQKEDQLLAAAYLKQFPGSSPAEVQTALQQAADESDHPSGKERSELLERRGNSVGSYRNRGKPVGTHTEAEIQREAASPSQGMAIGGVKENSGT